MRRRGEFGAVAGVDLEPTGRDPALIRLRISDRDRRLRPNIVAELEFRLSAGRRPQADGDERERCGEGGEPAHGPSFSASAPPLQQGALLPISQ
jgi:hypothetical protein